MQHDINSLNCTFYTVLLEIFIFNKGFNESVWCKIKLSRSKMLQGVCYRLYATEEADQGIYRLLEMANKETSLRLQLLY